MIAKAEQLLLPGQMPQSDVAFLFPRSSFAWDVPAGSCPHGNESPASQAMDYAAVLAGKPVLLAFSESFIIDFTVSYIHSHDFAYCHSNNNTHTKH